VLQLEHRATILGDLSAGAVMESQEFQEQVGGDIMIFYGLSITHANAIMSDGKSLEKVGVMPDERLLPTPDDLHAGKDPVLARAIELAGGHMDAAAAGKLFPYEWPAF
jgi:C-terminal processing protease CtpA/Prc